MCMQHSVLFLGIESWCFSFTRIKEQNKKTKKETKKKKTTTKKTLPIIQTKTIQHALIIILQLTIM